jgi:alpha-beta hydrolase superfamily lysophospholipase
VKHSTDTIESASGKVLFTQRWQPETEVRAVFVIAHGLTEHSDRYLPLVEYFVERGVCCYALDHEGHGRSEGQRAYIRRFDDYVESLNTLVDIAQEENPDKKVFLIGHSMGGAISVNYLLKYQHKLAGCFLSGAAISVGKVIGPVQQQVLKWLSMVVPKTPLIKIEGEAVSRNPDVVQAYETDPLVYRGKATARLLAEIVKGAKKGLARAKEITLPMMILHGEDDRLATPDGSEALFDKISSGDKTLIIYPELYHEIFLEDEKYEVFGDMEEWLEKHL